MTNRPRFIEDRYLLTLDFAKASGNLKDGNAIEKIQKAYPGMSHRVAMCIVAYWLSSRHLS